MNLDLDVPPYCQIPSQCSALPDMMHFFLTAESGEQAEPAAGAVRVEGGHNRVADVRGGVGRPA